ncbi:MAG: hypothetical protein V3T14_11200 [Myxococcota bacterium]
MQTRLEGSPKVAARPSAMCDGDWKLPWQVREPASGSQTLITPKVSSGLAPSRCHRYRSVKT